MVYLMHYTKSDDPRTAFAGAKLTQALLSELSFMDSDDIKSQLAHVGPIIFQKIFDSLNVLMNVSELCPLSLEPVYLSLLSLAAVSTYDKFINFMHNGLCRNVCLWPQAQTRSSLTIHRVH